MKITGLDHLVLTVIDPAQSVDFYTRVLSMEARSYGDGRLALHFGTQKINLHRAGEEIEPRAARPLPGSADLCLTVDVFLEEALAHLQAHGVAILLGPVERTGALGPMQSLYFRDPDENLIELASYPGTP